MRISQLKALKSKAYIWSFLAFSLFFLVFILNGCIGSITGPPTPGRSGSTWTVMIFLNGDNDLYNQAAADLNSMEMVGSTNDVKIIVQYDSLFSPTMRYLIQRDSDPFQITSPVLQQLGEINMGDAAHLVDFVRFCAKNYPAEKYALILWNHGSGFKGKNISFDQTSNDDSISIPELGQALMNAKAALGSHIHFLGMDACLMAMVEVAYEIRNSSNLLIASQESVPGEGWDYTTFLSNLTTNPTLNEMQLAQIVVDSFINQFPSQDVNISVTDLSRLDELSAAIGQLSQAILSDKHTSPLVYIDTGDSSQYFSDYDFIDLGDFVSRLFANANIQKPEVKSAAALVKNLLSQAVIYNRTNGGDVARSHGLSIYFPYFSYHPQYDFLAFNQETAWYQVIQKLFAWRNIRK